MVKILLEGKSNTPKDILIKVIHRLIKNRFSVLSEEIESMKKQVAFFEKKYGISSNRFLDKWVNMELGQDADFLSWAKAIDSHIKLETEQKELEELMEL